MAEGIRWRKAVIISMLLHSVMLICFGWMAAKVFIVHDIPEQYVELDLVGEPVGSAGAAQNAAADNIPAVSSPAAPTPVPTPVSIPDAPSEYKEQAPFVQAADSSMSLETVETGGNTNNTGASSEIEGNGTGSEGAGTGNGSAGSGNGKSGKGGGIISPGILSRVEPNYPERARRAGQEGTVVLRIQILENGRPGQVSVYHSSGWDLLDNAAVDAVQRWRFIPAKEHESGQAVVCYTTMPVVFHLKS